MTKRPFGQTGLHVSEPCLGTMSFGWRTRLPKALALLDRYHELGGNFVEAAGICSDLVAQPDWIGLPESSIGEWLKSRRIPRDEIVVATRMVWSPSLQLPAGNVAVCCENSLRRLGTDYLDLLVCDWVQPNRGLDDMMAALTKLVDQGKVRHLGVSGFNSWRASELARATSSRDLVGVAAVQDSYSLMERRCEPDLLNFSGSPQLGFLARSPLAGGFLAAPHSDRPLPQELLRQRNLRRRYNTARGEAVRSAVETIASDVGTTMAQVALAWVLANPAVSAAVIAPLSLNQLNDSVEASTLDLAWSQLRRLDLLSSGEPPGFPAAESLPEPFETKPEAAIPLLS